MIVVDASALVEIVTRSPNGLNLRKLTIGAELHAPDFLDLEVASGLRDHERGRRLEASEAQAMLMDLFELPIGRHPSNRLLATAWRWRDNLTIYDALYLELAIQADAPLLSIDRGLRSVAVEQTAIQVLPPDLDP